MKTEFKIGFDNILAFTTGSSSEPPIGFHPTPSLSFHSSSLYPRANTCANVLCLPLVQMSFENFVYFVSSGVWTLLDFDSFNY